MVRSLRRLTAISPICKVQILAYYTLLPSKYMKVLATIILTLIGLFYSALTLGYFSELWGGIGFLGALVALPIAIPIFIIIELACGTTVIHAFLVGLSAALYHYLRR